MFLDKQNQLVMYKCSKRSNYNCSKDYIFTTVIYRDKKGIGFFTLYAPLWKCSKSGEGATFTTVTTVEGLA